MEKFNIKRFWQTFKWLLYENKNMLLLWALGLTLGFFMIDSFLVWSMQQVPQEAKLAQKEVDFDTVAILGVIGFCFFIALIVIGFGYSRIFASLKTKQKRIAYLTLPATNAERFVSSLLYVLVVFPFCVMLALVLGDTLRMFTFGLTGGEWQSAVPYLFKDNMLFLPRLSSWSNFVGWMKDSSILLWICSLYILGGTWFRRHAFFIVTGGLIALFIIVVAFIPKSPLITFNASTNTTNISVAAYILTFIFLAAAFFNFWWSYKIFKRFQIITSKWTNV